MNNTTFYDKAITPMKAETDRLDALTGALDRDPAEKREQIAEYKCAKYRYAAVSAIHSSMYNCRRVSKLHNLQSTCHLLLPFYEMIEDNADFRAEYDRADDARKPDVALYYAMNAFADRLIGEKESLLSTATDWERIELEEYLGGYRFAKACIAEAWEEA